MKKILILLLAISLLIVGCSGENEEVVKSEDLPRKEITQSERDAMKKLEAKVAEQTKEKEEEPIEEEEVDRKSEIEKAVKDRYSDGDYKSTNIDKVRVNDDAGTGEGYILLVDLTFTAKNRAKTANEMMRMYSDDLVATLAKKRIEDINELAIFWTDEYNDRNVKYAYEYRDGNFFVTDIAGE